MFEFSPIITTSIVFKTICYSKKLTIWCLPLSFLLSEPASVTGLSIKTSSTTSLSFQWSPPEGDFQIYEVFLYKSNESLQESQWIQPSIQQCSFQGLRPGALYNLVILVHSGDQTNETSMLARTGESRQMFNQSGKLWC